jgi:hypothetical protein
VIDARYLALLDEFGTSSHEHEKGSLRDHLIGTYDLLSAWGCDHSVLLGGLCHSIYGTQYYRISSADLSSRPRVAEVIGDRAELLAFLFCVTDRTGFIYEAGRSSPKLWDNVHGQLIPVDKAIVRDLIEIEAANLIEQRHDDRPMQARYVTQLLHMLERGGPHMSTNARNAFATMVTRTMAVSGVT